ncbi:hypothetical protein GCM10009555_059600 [Acrocarpospora macrocephala]|uniref:Alpha/beta hydrolase n=1 Tax=Acrocarpospora macrocephala TaxID=150177 RepID=A0A5M3WR78_9ACTN|nr:hypothetical protein [Acrocarpospora macrocephala]GES11815.1 hypothetical protein Amac_054120 [Acrocarpospora macrocephala]
MTTLVFIHGRGQEGKKPEVLLRSWRAALAAGLVAAGQAMRPQVAAVMPYYGNVLHRLAGEAARQGRPLQLESMSDDDPLEAPFHPHLTEEAGEIERRLIIEMAAARGGPLPEEGLADLLSWGPARNALTWLSRHSRLDQEIIKAFLQDVAVYLSYGREQVLATVRAEIPAAGPIVLVTHSLGTVVARDLLDEPALRDRVTLWVTAGSPLGLPSIQRNLLSKGAHNPGVQWVTAYDVNDIVALGHPLVGAWGRPLEELEVDNGAEPHDIVKYLSHGSVAGPIARALT